MSDEDTRIAVVAAILGDPWWRQQSADFIARSIVEALDQRAAAGKWDEQRKDAMQRAESCWVPETDLLRYLNSFPGQPLTMADLHAIKRDGFSRYEPWHEGDRETQADCLRVYH